MRISYHIFSGSTSPINHYKFYFMNHPYPSLLIICELPCSYYVLWVCTAYINTSKLLQWALRLVSKPLLWIYYDAEEGRQIMMSIVRNTSSSTCVL